MKGLAFGFALAVLLALPPTALAKGETSVKICGPQGCKAFGDARQLGGFPDGGPTGELPPPAPYYELHFTSRGGGASHTWSTWYVPRSKFLADFDEREGTRWMVMDEPKLAWAAAGLRPFPMPEIAAVTIGFRRVTTEPASYLRLLRVRAPNGTGYLRKGSPNDWEQITFVSNQRSPWTLPQSNLHFSPSTGLLRRGVEVLKLPEELSSDLRHGRPIATDAPGFPVRTVVFGALVLLALLAAAGAVRPVRRRLPLKMA
jgi:hypothetical protein